MLEYSSTRSQHVATAMARMGAFYPNSAKPDQPMAYAAYRLAIKWLAGFAHTHKQWTRDIERIPRKYAVDWITSELGLSGAERTLVGLFVAVLLDVAVEWFLEWELGRSTPGREMFAGTVLDTLRRFDLEEGT